MRSKRRSFSRFRRKAPEVGLPKFQRNDVIGDFTVIFYRGHTDVNQRDNHIMAKPQHWYRCRCKCGTEENRSQQELIDTRRQQKCYKCRDTNPTAEE